MIFKCYFSLYYSDLFAPIQLFNLLRDLNPSRRGHRQTLCHRDMEHAVPTVFRAHCVFHFHFSQEDYIMHHYAIALLKIASDSK